MEPQGGARNANWSTNLPISRQPGSTPAAARSPDCKAIAKAALKLTALRNRTFVQAVTAPVLGKNLTVDQEVGGSKSTQTWKLCPTMAAADVTATLDMALRASGLDRLPVDHRLVAGDEGRCNVYLTRWYAPYRLRTLRIAWVCGQPITICHSGRGRIQRPIKSDRPKHESY